MKTIGLLGFLLLCFSTAGMAGEKASRESVEKLMELTEASKMIDSMYAQVSQMFEGMAEQIGIAEAERPAFDEYMQKVFVLMREEMSWASIKEPTIDIYLNNFSEEEIRGLIEFYGSDVGKSMIKKMPVVMQESMGISQAMLKKAMPKIQALAVEMQSEIAASRENNKGE
jgi:hypothetical protein